MPDRDTETDRRRPAVASTLVRPSILVWWFGLMLLAHGCAAPRKKEPAVFFPSAPDLPRIQFLTAFSGLRDVQEQSAFNRFVVGELQDVRVDKAYGIAVYDGKLYVCDTNATIFVFDLKSKTFAAMKGTVGPGTLRQPTNISIEPDGTKYIADPVRGQIVVFNRNDEYVTAYGQPGDWRPVDAVTLEDRVYVADVAHGLVKVFDKHSGEMVKAIGDKGAPSERLDRPTNLAFDREGYLYVTDAGRFQIVKFDRDGHFKRTFGRPGDNYGHFARPKGIALDRDGRLYAVDASFNNVQIFNGDGRLLMFFGGTGDKRGGFVLPAKVTIDYDNLQYFQPYVEPGFRIEYLIFVTSQFGDRRVNVFAFGQQEGVKYLSDVELRKQIEEQRKREQEKAQQPKSEPPKLQ